VRPSFDSLTRISQHKRVGHFAGESFDITITPGIAAAGLRLPARASWGLHMDRDFWFYRRRATEEAWAAKRAITASARERHEALARSFREKLERLEEGELLTHA
jgi:hypothetical protein